MTRPSLNSGLRAVLITPAVLAAATAAAQLDQPPGFKQNATEGPSPQPTASFEQLITDLASPDFHTRELATVKIREDVSVSLRDLETVLKTRELSNEAHARLLTIARERFAASPRAAMGVQFDLTTLRDRVVIDDTFAPFPCHKLLEPGDIIIEADGISLTNVASRPTIQGLIISRDPGDSIKLVIRRGKEKLTLDVKLGDFRELRNNSLDEVRLYRAWKTRSLAYARAEAPVKPPVHPNAWPDAIEASRQRQAQQMRGQTAGPAMVVHAGGRARSSNVINDNSWYSTQLRGANGRRIDAWGANAQALQMVLDFDEPVLQPPLTFAEEVEKLGVKRTTLEKQLELTRRDVERSPIGSAEAAVYESRVAKAELGLRAVERQLEAITAEKQEIEAEAARKRSSAASAEEDK